MDTLTTERLVLEPLTRDHAAAMYEVLSDPQLYAYLDYGPPPSLDHLRGAYEQLEARVSPDGSELWLNWVVRPRVEEPQGGEPVGEEPVGFVQATVAGAEAWVAYVLARGSWGNGYASEATRAVVDHLRSACGVTHFLATTEAENGRSIRLLERLGFRPATQAESREHELSATERLFVL